MRFLDEMESIDIGWPWRNCIGCSASSLATAGLSCLIRGWTKMPQSGVGKTSIFNC